MSEELLNILKHQELPIDNEQLIAYLTGKLTPEQEHELEKQLEPGSPEAAMLEGLRHMRHPEKLRQITADLNNNLVQQLRTAKPPRRKALSIGINWWLVGIIALLAFAALAWYLVHLYSKAG